MTNSDRPFRFGVSCWPISSAEEWKATARQAEELGYSTFLVPDHLTAGLPAPIPALVAAAAATERIRVGTSVLSNDFRPPALLALEMATLDTLSDGRLEVGLGAGWMEQDYASLGLEFRRPADRIDRLEEAVVLLKHIWATGEVPDHAGRWYQVAGTRGLMQPLQLPRPPLLIGGGGRRLLSLAAREADIVGVQSSMASGDSRGAAAAHSAGPEATRQKLEWVMSEAGARFSDIELMVVVPFVRAGNDRLATAPRVAEAHGVTAERLRELPQVLIGTPEQMAEDLLWRREHYGFSYVAVFKPAIEMMAPVIELLRGK